MTILTLINAWQGSSNYFLKWKTEMKNFLLPTGTAWWHLPFRYPCGVLDCLVCTKTVRVTTFPTTMAKARLTMNTTAKMRLINPQQQTVQRGARDWPNPSSAWAAAVRLNGQSVVASRTAVLLGTLVLGSRAVMAQDRLVFPLWCVLGPLTKPCPGLRNYPVEK